MRWIPASLLLARQRPGQPIQALVKAVAGSGTGRLDKPLPVAHTLEAKLLRDLRSRHRVREILLVREHKNDGVTHLILVQHLGHLLARILDAIAVVTIHHKDETLCVLVVVAPEGADLVLTANVPDRE